MVVIVVVAEIVLLMGVYDGNLNIGGDCDVAMVFVAIVVLAMIKLVMMGGGCRW